jgi:hypothetical protein
VKYWEIILENLRNVGWNCGSMTTMDSKGRSILVVPAFLELESAIRAHQHSHECDCPEHHEELENHSPTISEKPVGNDFSMTRSHGRP